MPGLSYIKMDSSRSSRTSSLVASIDTALDKLLYKRKKSTTSSDRIELGIIMRWLCAVRTFCFCSTNLAYNVETLTLNFPKTNVLGFLDFLIEDYLMEVNSSNLDSKTLSCVPKIREHLIFLKSFMGKLAELRNQQENLHQDVWNLAAQMAYKIESLIDQLVLGDTLHSFSRSLQSITKAIMILEADSLNLFSNQGRQEMALEVLEADSLNIFTDQRRQEIFKVQQITCPLTDKFQSTSSSDEVVGFESEKDSIVNGLMAGFQKLQVVAIVGMPGLGKTTLATKVYRDPYVTHHFHVKAWCSISQVFDRRRVLFELLNQIQPGESTLAMNEGDLSLKLWRSLKRRRYLIFIDDVWDTKSFDLLKGSLPDDSYQSRILLTSRLDGVVPEALLDDKPLFLRHLTVDESLELLKRKLFPAHIEWPSELYEIGMEIAEYCKGLPLTVVIIAGLLKTTEQEGWKDVLQTLRSKSSIFDVTDQCGSTIEVSYKHLPDHLKPCFLWFGAFPEDHVYSIKEMIWLWISEGLIRKNESKSLEDVGRDYLNNLIVRSLVMNGEGRSAGGVKTCRIHDLLHDFCMRKANGEYFLHVLKANGSREQGGLSSGELETLLIHETENLCSVETYLRRLCIYSEPNNLEGKVFCPRLRSLLVFNSIKWDRDQKLDLLSYISRMFKLLRVLRIDKVDFFRSEIGALVQLRYLAIKVRGYVGPEIGKLSNLETLILTSSHGGVVNFPDTLWNLRKLRHLYSKYVIIELPVDDSNSSRNLLELQTLCKLRVTYWSILQKQLSKFPNIRQMKCKFDVYKDECVNDSKVLDFSVVSQLESLSLVCLWYKKTLRRAKLVFPENIKKLTLQETCLPWKKIASIAKLPDLEVLKLIDGAFSGDTWHAEEGEFPKLKFLKLNSLNLVKWTAASDDLFPNLEKLVLEGCCDLEEVPECLQYVENLDTIEVIDCRARVVRLLRRVEEFQKDMGNSSLQFFQRGTCSCSTHSSHDELSGDE